MTVLVRVLFCILIHYFFISEVYSKSKFGTVTNDNENELATSLIKSTISTESTATSTKTKHVVTPFDEKDTSTSAKTTIPTEFTETYSDTKSIVSKETTASTLSDTTITPTLADTETTESTVPTITTEMPDKIASEPLNLTVYNVSFSSFSYSGTRPTTILGDLLAYGVNVKSTSDYDEKNHCDEMDLWLNNTDDIKNDHFNGFQDNLNPDCNYTISVFAITEAGNGTKANVSFGTLSDTPIEISFNFSNVTSTSFTVSWDKPKISTGEIFNYTVTIKLIGPDYERDLNCNISDQQPPPQTTDATQYTFLNAKPYYKYTVSINATSSPQYQFYSEEKVNRTKPSAPGKPNQLTMKLTHIPEEFSDSDLMANITWTMPCDLNGQFKLFKLNIIGLNDSENDTRAFTTSVNFFKTNVKYWTNYSINVQTILETGEEGDTATTYKKTPAGFPGKPILMENYTDANNFNITWSEPKESRGPILKYYATISALGPVTSYRQDCDYEKNETETEILTNYLFKENAKPYYKYKVSILATTEKGNGTEMVTEIITKSSVPDNLVNTNVTLTDVRDIQETYNAKASLHFEPPCYVNGPFENYEISYYEGNEHLIRIKNISLNDFSVNLKAETPYNVTLKISNEKYSNQISKSFPSPSGVPQFIINETQFVIKTEKTQAQLHLKKDYFNETNGKIRYLALLLSTKNYTSPKSYSYWINTTWPSSEDSNIYEITKQRWNPFNDRFEEVNVVIGEDTNCTEHQHCNKPLNEDTEYFLTVRLFTNDFYKDSPALGFRTAKTGRLALILGLIFGLLGVVLVGLFIVWKRNVFNAPTKYLRQTSDEKCNLPNTSIPIHKFISYCKNLEGNTEKLKAQFVLLGEKSKEIANSLSTTYALKPENRRKNRYINILPFDETRVKLNIDEDDEISSDYINASYIRGYSQEVEYIATQGPLSTTCKDFWKMIFQENVTIIVMVSQFIEQNKEKCYKYFPNNHESMIISEDMEVRCSTELHFGSYCVRTLQVKKDDVQLDVTHMQFLDWPDFDVPKGTESMLQFCYQFRERLKYEGGYAIVHCSAGVGRTGTLIATDILLQTIRSGKNIDVFNTVMELRSQRVMMVQAEKQYLYIHNLLKDNLEHPANTEMGQCLEPLYENMSVLRTIENEEDEIYAESEFNS